MNKEVSDVIFENGKEYRLVYIRDRGKYVARDGDALNPYKRNQKATVHYNEDGYPCFGGGVCCHLYVAHAWVDGYQEGYEVNHKDCDRTNYHADNLEWISHIDNVHYSSDQGKYSECKIGKKNGRAVPINVYSKDNEFIERFDTMKDCALWILKQLDRDATDNKILNIYSGIRRSIDNKTTYKNYYFQIAN